MKSMLLSTLALAIALCAGNADAASAKVTDASAPRALDQQGPVQVRWEDPAQFSEIRLSSNRWESERGKWIQDLATHLRKSASSKLTQGQTLDVTLTDIKLAGDYEPWRGPRLNDVRIVRDIYPPRINLSFALRDAQGVIIDQGERRLSDPGYLQGLAQPNSQDALRYEKRLLDDWLRRELRTERATAGI